ncbi:MAG: hypothetical protein ACP5IZ_11460 [Thermoprotei archaeon]|jgi:hypothetical protein
MGKRRKRGVSEATAEIIILSVIMIGFIIYIGVWGQFLRNWGYALYTLPNTRIATHTLKPGYSLVLPSPDDPSLFHIIISPINYGNYTSQIAFITIYTQPPSRIQTIQIKNNTAVVYREDQNATIYKINNGAILSHTAKTVLDVLVRVITTQTVIPIPSYALITYADGYSVRWYIPLYGPMTPVRILFYVEDTEFVYLFNYTIVLDRGAPYEKVLYSNASGWAEEISFKETWVHITLPDPYPPSNYESRDFAFVWVSANTPMSYPFNPLQRGPKIPPALPPPLGASFPSYTGPPLVIPTNGTGVGTWQNDFWIYTGDYDIIYVFIFYKTLWGPVAPPTWPPP